MHYFSSEVRDNERNKLRGAGSYYSIKIGNGYQFYVLIYIFNIKVNQNTEALKKVTVHTYHYSYRAVGWKVK